MTTRCAPDSIEPISAWRVWSTSLHRGEVRLDSPTQRGKHGRWVPGQALEAHCPRGCLHAPTLNCQCGIYACKTRDQAVARARFMPRAAIGEVALWGRVIEHQDGYRAQYAMPLQLWIPVSAEYRNTVVNALARRDSLLTYAAQVGLCDSESGLPVALDDLRRIFQPNPRPPRPIGVLLRTIFWSVVRALLVVAGCIAAFIVGGITAIAIVILAPVLPVAAGRLTAAVVGANHPLLGTLLGTSAALAVLSGYALLFWKAGIYRRLHDL
jgi:hypothetical protein